MIDLFKDNHVRACMCAFVNFFFKQEGQNGPSIAHLNFLDYPSHFFFLFLAPFREEFTRICLCLYSPHSLIPCLLTDQNFASNF